MVSRHIEHPFPITKQAFAQVATFVRHLIHSSESHVEFSHSGLHPPLQLQQKILHLPLPQHPKSGFRLQHSELTLIAIKEIIKKMRMWECWNFHLRGAKLIVRKQLRVVYLFK
ncbi:hypothetical protein Glove_642g5 [Diversispora epigaea]|uniref:Uncharacterized protein n=1 Tax=Diversispora epigaea TaxID=1348612 RepID=A0A397G7S3_9GLOM|nr:hypothetical protein Glove_642g5 [Diversispora epigaea]